MSSVNTATVQTVVVTASETKPPDLTTGAQSAVTSAAMTAVTRPVVSHGAISGATLGLTRVVTTEATLGSMHAQTHAATQGTLAAHPSVMRMTDAMTVSATVSVATTGTTEVVVTTHQLDVAVTMCPRRTSLHTWVLKPRPRRLVVCA